MLPIKNNVYKVEITGYTSAGLGFCKIDEFVVFVHKAVKGDIANIKIIKVTKNIAYAIIEELLEPSVNRISSECKASKKCGGCTLWHMDYEQELEFKREKVESAIKKIGKIDFDLKEIEGSQLVKRYRNKAQYPVREQDGKAIFGFYRANSHDIIEVEDCLIQTEKSNEIAKYIVDFLNKHKIPAYNEQKHTGFIRHVYIRTGFKTGDIMVCIVSKSEKIPKIEILYQEIMDKFPKVSSFLINENNEKTNRILGEKYKAFTEKNTITDYLCENKFEIAPASFYQVNRQSAEKLYNKAIEFCDFSGNETVLDMFCGVGTITLAVAKHVSHVTGIEIVEDAITNAKENAKINEILNADFIVGDASKAVKRFEKEKIDVILVDPPRKGLDNDTISSIITINPEKIAYVSCDPATLARDIKMFSENGYELKKAIAFDLFPRTFHVESVCLLSKLNA